MRLKLYLLFYLMNFIIWEMKLRLSEKGSLISIILNIQSKNGKSQYCLKQVALFTKLRSSCCISILNFRSISELENAPNAG